MLVEIVLLVLLLLFWFYYIVTKQFDYFKKKGVKFSQPSFPFGSSNNKKLVLQNITFNHEVTDLIKQQEFAKEKVFGYFAFGQPIWVVNDEEMAKNILIKDFDHFTDLRMFYVDGPSKVAKINKHFFINMTGSEWKKARSLTGSVFTSQKLKLMSSFVVKCGQNMEEELAKAAAAGQDVEIKDFTGMFTLDAICTSGFGIETNSFEDPKNLMRRKALELMRHPDYVSNFEWVKTVCCLALPRIARLFDWQMFPSEPTLFLSNVVQQAYSHRKKTGERRNDVIDVLADEMDQFETLAKSLPGFDPETFIISNALLVFLAGFDTTSLGLGYILHALAKHQDVQQMVVDEIEEVMGEEEVLTFEHLQALEVMDRVIHEVFRHSDLTSHNERLCTKDYKIPGTDFVIEKGRFVKCYTRDLSMDPKNFKNPLAFDPENFAKENNHNKFGFQFFGAGPRGCPGIRYAMMVTKIGLVHMLRKCKWTTCSRTVDNLELHPVNQLSSFKDGCWVRPLLRD